MTRVTLDLAGDQALVIRAIRFLLKRLGRDFGLRCTSVAIEESGDSTHGGGR